MKPVVLIAAALLSIGLAACDKPAVVVPTPVAVPGPAGPQGPSGTDGKSGSNSTVVVVPAASAASN
jgi:lipoprotein-anchoring transpeptidase ErfK/SrfK